MALLDDLTPEQKKEFEQLTQAELDKKLTEMGYDQHAKDVIARANNEAKTNRERAEKAEADLKKLADEKAARDEAEATRLAEEKKKKDAEKPLEEKFNTLKGEFEASKEHDAAERKKLADGYTAELSKRDQALLDEAMRNEAEKQGIIDPDAIKLFDYSDIPVENGRVNREKVAEKVKGWKESKSAFFKEGEMQDRDPVTGQFVARPSSTNNTSKDVDASKLPPSEFDALTERLRQGKA